MKLRLALFVLVVPVQCLADLRSTNDPPPPPTAVDARNAFTTLIIQWLLLIIALVALAWIIWWGVRLRRRQ